ncbi:MAG: glycosyltransferase family 4 protein [Muribaculaceae bacterium]|nr:glycosyltransferase family 4 protein [Muribaculaceae bacterium]
MKTVIIYIPTANNEISFKEILDGNPGVGGTTYCFMLLAHFLIMSEKYNIYIASNQKFSFPVEYNFIRINSIEDFRNFDNINSVLILKTPFDNSTYDFFETLRNLKIILWSHNFLKHSILRRIAKINNIYANVFVSKQAMDYYIDNDIIKKSTYIHNMVLNINDTNIYLRKTDKKSKIVTYMGCLIPQKGIIKLLKIWKLVEKKYPEAQLNIIGKGNLYNREVDLGELKIADRTTEKKIRPFILDQDGTIKKNIHFLGNLGKEKYEVFAQSNVGVVNPSAKTETFGLGIVEMNTVGLPVVTRNWNSHPEIIIQGKTGLLGFTNKQIYRRIVKLLEDNTLADQLGQMAKIETLRFRPENIITKWENLLDGDFSNNFKNEKFSISKPYWNNFKFIRILNSYIRFRLRMSFIPSILDLEMILFSIKQKIKRS